MAPINTCGHTPGGLILLSAIPLLATNCKQTASPAELTGRARPGGVLRGLLLAVGLGPTPAPSDHRRRPAPATPLQRDGAMLPMDQRPLQLRPTLPPDARLPHLRRTPPSPRLSPGGNRAVPAAQAAGGPLLVPSSSDGTVGTPRPPLSALLRTPVSPDRLREIASPATDLDLLTSVTGRLSPGAGIGYKGPLSPAPRAIFTPLP